MECKGPSHAASCPPHCYYKCPAQVVYMSNVSIILTIGFLIMVVGSLYLDRTMLSVLTGETREIYTCMTTRRWTHLLFGIVIGSTILMSWRPYAQYRALA